MRKLLVAVLMVPSMAHAEFVSGNDLFSKLNSTDYSDKHYALGYILGVFDAGQSVRHCTPNNAGVNAGQVQDIVKQYLNANPAIRNFSADLIVTDALKRIWPCATKPQGRPA
jgi:hypothetical protein